MERWTFFLPWSPRIIRHCLLGIGKPRPAPACFFLVALTVTDTICDFCTTIRSWSFSLPRHPVSGRPRPGLLSIRVRDWVQNSSNTPAPPPVHINSAPSWSSTSFLLLFFLSSFPLVGFASSVLCFVATRRWVTFAVKTNPNNPNSKSTFPTCQTRVLQKKKVLRTFTCIWQGNCSSIVQATWSKHHLVWTWSARDCSLYTSFLFTTSAIRTSYTYCTSSPCPCPRETIWLTVSSCIPDSRIYRLSLAPFAHNTNPSQKPHQTQWPLPTVLTVRSTTTREPSSSP